MINQQNVEFPQGLENNSSMVTCSGNNNHHYMSSLEFVTPAPPIESACGGWVLERKKRVTNAISMPKIGLA